jgi:hypothetical protein
MYFRLGLFRIVVMQMALFTSVDPIDSSRALPILEKVGAVRDDAAGATVGALIDSTMAPIFCALAVRAYRIGLEVWRQVRCPQHLKKTYNF